MLPIRGDYSLCPSYISTLDRVSATDHDVVNVKAHESLEFAANVPSHQTWFMPTTWLLPSCCMSQTSDFHQRLGASIKP